MVPSPPTSLPTWHTSRYVVVTLPVEIDLANSSDVKAQLLQVLEAGGAGAVPLIVDLTGSRFCDSTAVNALVQTHTRAVALGRGMYAAVNPEGPVRTVFDVTALPVLIQTCDDLGSAVALAVVSTLDDADDDGGDGGVDGERG
jgi:anti-sigma B factor antagonist